jgi:hypothetical protein
MKYVLVTGGVVSGLGKGVTASSIGVVLKACGLRITSIKIGTWPVSPNPRYGRERDWIMAAAAAARYVRRFLPPLS